MSFVSSGAVELCGSSVRSSGAGELCGSRGAVEGAADIEGAAYVAGEVFTFEVCVLLRICLRF